MTRVAGTIRHDEPYEARFPDKFGNIYVRHVARPEINSNYFLHTNVFDLHNQGRQVDLTLERSGSLKIFTFGYTQR